MESSDQSNWDRYATTVAFPTIGIILLGGISNKIERRPLHNSAGIAYTGIKDKIDVETSVFFSKNETGVVNGEEVKDTGDRSPFRLLRKYRESMDGKDQRKLSFISANHGVLSGSSDAAAASFAKAVKSLALRNIDEDVLEEDMRMISESAGRSYHGGLTITETIPGKAVTRSLLEAQHFRGFELIGCRFSAVRNPSDRIHENVVKNPNYEKRIASTRKKSELLIDLAEERDIEGIFDLAGEDTIEYHTLLESSGVYVITEGMRKFTQYLDTLKSEIWLNYIITGGSNVFVTVRESDSELITSLASRFSFSPVELKVAGPPEVRSIRNRAFLA
ncbi:MAG: diphosphomevalonate decarboxylase [Thermoplasmataceae archaeon]